VIFLLDTNVLSENTKDSPDPSVIAFLRAIPVENIRLSAVVLAEIAQGVENNPTAALKEFLADVLALPLADFGEMEALEWGRMTSAALKRGASLELRDSFIAATALTRGWIVATRNTPDFAGFGVKMFNPWTQKL
jgi:predicted nucleic acid-binding protein